MNDLISRQTVIDAIDNANDVLVEDDYTYGLQSGMEKAKYIIEDLSTAQPERTGKWIYGEHDTAMCDGYRCDKCGFFVPWDYKFTFIDFINDYHFCPNCGAKMLKEGDEE